MNENFVCTYLKVGTFQVLNNGQKQGGNVASYFCLGDGRVVHTVPGQTNADKLLSESRWAYEIRKSALTHATDLGTGRVDDKKYRDKIIRGHTERFYAETNARHAKSYSPVPLQFPHGRSQQAQAHWLLARNPLAKLDAVYPFVWTKILNEELSDRPVAKR
ncbi:MAG: hypothetical protein FJ303_24420 [Planctomycetes bacterium]|nr:hypothetical protein [Planctomycetota bacterium]